MTETWIVFKAESGDSQDWETRKLLPSGSLTDILAEQWDYSGRLPKAGDRLQEYANLSNPGNGVTHGKEGDWVVSGVQCFSSFDTDSRVVICYCEFQPIASHWQELKRGVPVSEMLPVAVVRR